MLDSTEVFPEIIPKIWADREAMRLQEKRKRDKGNEGFFFVLSRILFRILSR